MGRSMPWTGWCASPSATSSPIRGFRACSIPKTSKTPRFLKTLPDIQALHSPLVGQITTIVERGADVGIFRRDVDPVQLYISIAALGFFYVSNMATLSVIFVRDLSAIDMVQEREAQAVQMVLDYLRTQPS